ncbi:MAG: radical SAM protein [Deltaproteobacteria bacterium]|nr:radical SAM protein [Deltaproteobacteria bacterium]
MSQNFAACVEWELTGRCDLECVHCYVRRGRPRGRDLDRDEMASIASRLADLGCRSVTLSGGEPTLRRDWPRIADALSSRGVGVQLVSNGQRMGPAEARAASGAGVRLVLLSLDGLERTHDRIRRRRGSFGRVLAAAEALRGSDVPFGFLTTILEWNADELEGMEPLVSELGPALWQIWLAIPQSGGGPWPRRGRARSLARRI